MGRPSLRCDEVYRIEGEAESRLDVYLPASGKKYPKNIPHRGEIRKGKFRSAFEKKKHYGSIIAVVRPHAYDLDGALFFEDLVNQPMLQVDPSRKGIRFVDKFFKTGDMDALRPKRVN